MKNSLLFALSFLISIELIAQEISGPIKVHTNQRFLTTHEGDPFFWMADTAWELFHRLDEKEATQYLDKRKEQGFNVVQAVVLAELDGINTPNANGDLPFSNLEKWEYNDAYFDHIDRILDLALERNIHIAMLPTWGDKLFKNTWGIGPEIFNPQKAYSYGKWVGDRYKDRKNLIWIMGGDRTPRENSTDAEVWKQLAQGILDSQNAANPILISYHPQPESPGGSSNWFHSQSWLSFNMHQTGHCPQDLGFLKIQHDYSLKPSKPTLDSEPLYEEHPNCFDTKNGYSEASEIRRIMYQNVFAGGAGQTYGCHAVWQMYDFDKTPVNYPLRPWHQSLDLEMANQVKHLKTLMLSRPYFDRIPDQKLILDQHEIEATYILGTRDQAGTYAFIYFPEGNPIKVNTSVLKGKMVQLSWFDPRTGVIFPENNGKPLPKSASLAITPPSQGKGNDWVLILDAL